MKLSVNHFGQNPLNNECEIGRTWKFINLYLKLILKFLVVGWFSDPFCLLESFIHLSISRAWNPTRGNRTHPLVDSPASSRNVGSAVTENWMKNRIQLPPTWGLAVAIFHFIFQYISYVSSQQDLDFCKFPGCLGRNKSHGIGHTISHTRDKCRTWDNTIYDVLGYLIMIDLHVWYFALHFKQVQLFLLFSNINFGVWQLRSSLNFSGWSSIPNIFNRTRTNMKKHDGTIP